MEITLNQKEAEIFDILLKVVNLKSPETILMLCGGAVRDKLLNVNTSDIDIAVSNMSGEKFVGLVVEYLRDNNLFTKNAVIIKSNPDQSKHLETAMLEICGLSIDFVNLRKETYTDSRIPTMELGTIEEDASRRDLTINALYYNLHTKKNENYVGGLEDLKNKIARTPINPIQTFIDDPLRILRTIRFAVKYSLSVNEEIIWAARNFKVVEALKTKVSPDRIWKELAGYGLPNNEWKNGAFSISQTRSAKALELLHKMDLIDILFDNCDIDFYKSYYWLNEIGSYGKSEDVILTTLAIIFNHKTFSDMKNIEFTLLKLKCPKDIINRTINIIKSLRLLVFNYNTDRGIRLFLRSAKEDVHLIMEIAQAEFSGEPLFEQGGGIWDRVFKIQEEQGGYRVKPPITGKDLLEEGWLPGKTIGKALGELDDELLEFPNMTKLAALEFCEKFKSI